MSTKVMIAMWYAGMIAITLLSTNCAHTPTDPPLVIDVPCKIHKHNPHGNALVGQLWEMCLHGVDGACEAYGDIVRQGPLEEK